MTTCNGITRKDMLSGFIARSSNDGIILVNTVVPAARVLMKHRAVYTVMLFNEGKTRKDRRIPEVWRKRNDRCGLHYGVFSVLCALRLC